MFNTTKTFIEGDCLICVQEILQKFDAFDWIINLLLHM